MKKKNPDKNSGIDEIDLKILSALQHHGRLSFLELGAMVHLSSNAAAERVRRLEANGFIRGYRAEINHVKFGFSLQAYIDIYLQSGVSAQTFEAKAKKIPGIERIAILTGAMDLRVRVRCRDQGELELLIARLRTEAGAQETNTSVILRESEANGATQ
jgi:Lrp/AsnC family transcriptional regulator, leucine-responsive regulatory protein